MYFRLANENDYPQLHRVRMAVTENALSNPARITEAMYREYMSGKGRTWVCEIDGQIAAFSAADHQDHSIWALFVDPVHEGKGLGKMLLRLATNYLFMKGAEQIKLSTNADTRADRFYQAQGWQRGEMKDDVEVYFYLRAA